jgi:8-oxo-dGTP diphosphatase
MTHQNITVAVGILYRNNQVLVTQRKKGSRYELKWEFPGGKAELGETPEQALVRELQEELSITPTLYSLVKNEISHYTDGGSFSVHFYQVTEWMGDVRNILFEDIRWLAPEEVQSLDILEGNRSLVAELPALLLQSNP